MPQSRVLREFVSATIRAEKARRNLTFGQLSDLLRSHGIVQSATNLSTKVARGGMSAQLFIALLKVMGQERLELQGMQLAPAQKSLKGKKKKLD